MSEQTDLDHIALAFERAWDGFNRYGGDLGGEFLGGGPDPGFSWHQLRFANGMKVELLEPLDVEVDDFLRRYLDRNGPGPHHMTFKVPDIAAAIEKATRLGYEPVRINLEHPQWKEAFLHPKASHGIVVQLAWSDEHEEPKIDGLPRPRTGHTASLDQIVLTVADLAAARTLFEGVLDGRLVGDGDDHMGRFVDLAWPGPGRVRLVEPTLDSAVAWMGNRPGRIHHITFAAAHPIDGAIPRDDGSWEVPPERNHGTRLRLNSGPPT